jgi:hypothetical protein
VTGQGRARGQGLGRGSPGRGSPAASAQGAGRGGGARDEDRGGARPGEEEGRGRRVREKGKGRGKLTSGDPNSSDLVSKPKGTTGRERDGRGKLLRGRKSNETTGLGGGGARAWVGQGAPVTRGLDWAGPGRARSLRGSNTNRNSDREPKSELGRDEHAIKHDIRQRNML